MNLSNDLVNKFVEITNDETPNKEGSTAYGVTVQYGDRMYVKLDGSDLLTPVETTSAIKSGERVTVLIKDHNATVTGNLSDPSASSKDLTDIGDKIAEVDILIADKVDTKVLVAETARIEEMIATKASIGELEADRAEIEYLKANKAEISDLEASNAHIGILDSDLADIQTLINGHLTTDNMQSLILTSDKVTVQDAFIKDAMIDNISADKITSGEINTSLVSISSEDGSMTLNGSTQQFKDSNGVVRIQIGKDADGNFTFCLFSQDGVGVLLDEEGLHAGAVPDGLIVNDMVADNANISGGKLDINSVVTSINNGTTSIDSSKIYLDDESQSLKVAFDSLKTKVETIEEVTVNGELTNVIEQITNNTTNINVMQGQISSLIYNTTITTENGEVIQLKDDYNSTKSTVNSQSTKIGSLETNFNNLSIGGENLVKNSKTFSSARGPYDRTLWQVVDSEISGHKQLQINTTDMTYQEITLPLYPKINTLSGDLTISFEYTESEPNLFAANLAVFNEGYRKAEVPNVLVTSRFITTDIGNGWKKAYFVENRIEAINNIPEALDYRLQLKKVGDKSGSIEVRKIQVEKGNKATDYSPSVEDTNSQLASVVSKQASMELDLDGFRTEVSTTYATKDELNLSNYNLLSNGNFKNCYINTIDMIPSWIAEDPLKVEITPSSQNNNCIALYNGRETSTRGLYQDIVLKDGTTYTLTFKLGWEQNVTNGVTSYIGFYNENNSRIHTITVPVANNINNLDQIQSFTFTTPTDVAYHHITLKFYTGGAGTAGGIDVHAWFGEIKLEEGDTYTGWRGSEYDETLRIGGTNYVKNGDFSLLNEPANTIDQWIIGGDGVIYHQQGISPYNKKGILYFAHVAADDTYSGVYQPIYDLEPRTEYTLTFDIDWEPNVRSAYVDLLFYDEAGNASNLPEFRPNRSGRWSYTFVTPPNFHAMNVGLCHRGLLVDNSSFVLVSFGNVMLEKGNTPSDWTESPKYFTSRTEFNQTNEDFTFRISQAGGYNLLRNSKFHNRNATHWWLWGLASQWHDANYYDEGDMYLANGTAYNVSSWPGSRGGYWTHSIDILPNTVYTFSSYIEWEGNVQDAGVYFEYYKDGEYVSTTQHHIAGMFDNDISVRRSITFTTPPDVNSVMVGLIHEGCIYDVTGRFLVHFNSPCLNLGYSTVWSPHASEIYDGIVRIDRDGLTVQHGSNRSVLDSDALNFYAGDVRYSRVRGGKFEFTDSSGNIVGDVGKSTWSGTNRVLSSLNGRYGHSVGIGVQTTEGGNYNCPLVLCTQNGELSTGGGYYFQGVNISNPKVSGTMVVRGSTNDTIDLNLQGMMMFANHGNGYRTGNIFGNEEVHLGTQYGSELWDGFIVKENGNVNSKNELHAYGNLYMHYYSINDGYMVNMMSPASTYTTRLLNEGSVDNATYSGTTFTDGELRYVHRGTCHTVEEWDYNDEGVWSPLGVYYCYCELPVFMAENIELDYHVNIGKIGWGDYRVIEKNPYLFIVESKEEGFAFTWEVVAKRLEVARNNAVVANEYINTGRSQPIPQDVDEFTYKLDGEEFIEEVEEIQDNIITGGE